MRNLLSEYQSIRAYSRQGDFATGNTVTATVYRNGSATPETLTSNSCAEINGSGIFAFSFSNLVTAPTGISEYVTIMSNGAASFSSSVTRFGGWPEDAVKVALVPAEQCLVTMPVTDQYGTSVIDPEEFAAQASPKDYIELKAKYHDGSRYYKVGKYSPSYDSESGTLSWKLPRGASIFVKLSTFDIESTVTIPDQETITMYSLINGA